MELLPFLRRRACVVRIHPAQLGHDSSSGSEEPLLPWLLGMCVPPILTIVLLSVADLWLMLMVADPDMLQVGCEHGPGGARDPGLTPAETRTHFYAWVIVSSPLTLSHNVNDPTITKAVWPVIANTEALAVSKAYFGHSGTLFNASTDTVELTDAHIEQCAQEEAVGTRVCEEHEKVVVTPSAQYFYKPLDTAGKRTAVLMMNAVNASASLSFNFADVPGLKCTSCHVRDIHAHKDMGAHTGTYSQTVEGHDVAFLVVSDGATGELTDHFATGYERAM